MKFRGCWLLLCFAIWPATVSAKFCGDDVEGRDVPCACGDTIVSNVILGDDPVARLICVGDALLVRANSGAEPLAIDLAGKTLRGDGHGAGLWIINGGRGGATVTSSNGKARLEGFQDGVRAHGADSLALLEHVVIVGSGRDGVRINGQSYVLQDVRVQASERDGFSLTGFDFRLTATQASDNRRNGYFVMGRRATIATDNSAQGNGTTGFSIAGDSHKLLSCVSSLNGGKGLRLLGSDHEVRNCVIEANLDDGISGDGSRWQLGSNRATNNGRHGIAVRGIGLVDLGGNRGLGNGALISDPHHPAVQCQIGVFECEQ